MTVSPDRPGATRFLALFFLAFALALVGLPAAPAHAAAPDITIRGGGWGHGVGLSQYGAYGQALLDGATADEILSHYYEGTTAGELGTDFADPGPIWVNLEREATSIDLYRSLFETGAEPATITRGDTTVPFAGGSTLAVDVVGEEPDGTPQCVFTVPGFSSEPGPCEIDITWDGFEPAPTSLMRLTHVVHDGGDPTGAACTLPDWNAVPSTLWRTCSYRYGALHVRPDDNSASFHLVVEVDVDDYVHGISEMPYYWGLPTGGPNGQAALEAQAIAARSYAVHRAVVRGPAEDRPWCHCQLYDTTVDQRYVGYGHVGLGHERWALAVASTAGIVRAHPDATYGGDPIPVQTFYGSSTFGRTEPSEVGFTDPVPYLTSVDDHWAIDPAVGNPYATWEKTFTASSLAAALGWPAGSEVVTVDILACSPSGAAAEIRFTDGAGLIDTRATRNLRTALGLRSPQITNIGNPIDGPPPCGGLGDNGVELFGLTVDDGPTGDSVGNDDGIAACGEVVELRTSVRNLLAGALTGVTMTIATDDPNLTVLHNTSSPVADIPGGEHGPNLNDWDIAVSPTTPDGHVAELDLSVSAAEGGPWAVTVQLPVACLGQTPPPLSVGSLRVDDGPTGDSRGDGDGIAACGETIELYVTLSNDGEEPLTAVRASLSLTDPGVTLLHNVGSTYPDVAAAGSAENRNDWDLALASSLPDGHVVPMILTVEAVELDEPVVLPADLVVACGEGTPPDGPPSVPVMVSGHEIDDRTDGDSVGNGDGIAACGETIELYLDLASTTGDPFTLTAATFSTDDPYLTLLHNASSAYPEVPGNGSARNENDFDLAVSPGTPAGHEPTVRLTIESGVGGPWTIDHRLPPITCDGAGPESIAFSGLTVDDGIRGESVGDNDRRAECGEVIELYVALTNQTGRDLSSVTTTLSTSDPYLTLLYNSVSPYPAMIDGASGENGNDWDIRIAANAPDGHVAVLDLSTSAGGGAGPWPTTVSLPLFCG